MRGTIAEQSIKILEAGTGNPTAAYQHTPFEPAIVKLGIPGFNKGPIDVSTPDMPPIVENAFLIPLSYPGKHHFSAFESAIFELNMTKFLKRRQIR